MRKYRIYKKRDGQSFKAVGLIECYSFDEACKKFAKQMTDDFHESKDNKVFLDKENDSVS